MSQPTFKLIATAAFTGCLALSLHAQMAQDPLLSRTASVEPNIVFMFDDSGSMPATAIYQYGGNEGGLGMTGPGNDAGNGAPTTFHGRSPDVNQIYYDPRTTYSRRINADGTFQAAGATAGINSFNVYFYKPPLSNVYKVSSVTLNSRGSGYPASVTGTFSVPPPNGGVQATATVQTTSTQNVSSVTVPNRGSGYPSTGVTATFSPPNIAGGVQATGTVQTGNSSAVTGVTVSSGGRDYPPGVTATFTPPPPAGGVAATGNVVLNTATNKVSAVTVTGIGSGLTAGATATFSNPDVAGGVRATGTVTIASTQRVNSALLVSGGTGYTSTPTVTFTAPTTPGGVRATGTANRSGGSITSITINTNGSGYTSPPTITFSSGNANFNAVLGNPTNTVTGFTLTNGGSGYTSTPTISLSGGGTAPTFTRTMAPTNFISGITMTNVGAGYSSAPTIVLNNVGSGTGATLTANTTTTRGITGITVVEGGSGYTSAPTVIINASSGGGAAFTVNTGTTNMISGVTVTNSGAGYYKLPTLTLSPSAGPAATYTVNTAITATNVQPPNTTWDGAGVPTTSSSYFTTGSAYTPDFGSPLAVGADATLKYPNQASSSTANYPKFRNRTDCGDSSTTSCTWAQERQNYANWKTYHSTRLELAKTGIGLAFQPLNPSFRLGWATINTLDDSSVLDKGVRLYTSTVQSEFLTWLYGRPGNGSTPNRIALDRVGQYFQRTDDGGPWANSPTGDTAITSSAAENRGHATCRRSYAMLMTDGYYNDSFSISDTDTTDGPQISQGGSYRYSPVGPYSDTKNGTQIANTFADVAMKYWVNDLRPNIDNNLKSVPGDPAYWQHLNFYAIGLGINGTLDASDPQVLQSLTGDATSRALNWPTPSTDSAKSIDDMWHATINGRGKMLNAKTASELNSSILQMMSDIGGKEGTQSGVAVSTASLKKDTRKYTPSYIPITWNGNVTAHILDPSTGFELGIAWQIETLLSTDPITGVKTYSSIIPSAASRNIYVGNGATSGTRAVPFKYASMGTLTSSMTGTVNASLIDYLRGDATNEDSSATTSSSTAIYRGRSTRLGDIVNSTPTFVKDTTDLSYEKLPGTTPGQSTYRAFVDGSGSPLAGGKKQRAEGVLFVGANDGMLHAFRDGTNDPVTGAVVNPGGIETFAYVPNALLPTLNQLADKAYVHRYYVDGPNTETDAYFTGGTPRWANIVLGSTGAGAGAPGSATDSPRTAVYAMDVTSLNSGPTTLNASSVLWEIGSSKANFSELGYVLTDIQAGPTPDGSWVAIFGNGYESKSCQARLYVVNIETGARIREINTNAGNCATAKNGLGGVRLVRNASQQVIGVYAGDLLGNLWKFNLNNTDPNNWGVDLAGSPLFKAGATQPITAQPTAVTLASNGIPAGGYMVIFGTGKFYEVGDITTNATQSLYGIWDPLAFGASSIPAGTALTDKTKLVQQSIGDPQVGPDGNTYFSLSQNTVDYVSASPNRGWYTNLRNSGQRNVYPLDLLSGKFVIADTISPSNVSLDPCANQSGGTGYRYLMNALTGGAPTKPVLDTNGDGNIDSSDMLVSGLEGKADGRNVTLSGEKTATKDTYYNVGGGDPGATKLEISCEDLGTCLVLAPTKIKSREWRQLFLR